MDEKSSPTEYISLTSLLILKENLFLKFLNP